VDKGGKLLDGRAASDKDLKEEEYEYYRIIGKKRKSKSRGGGKKKGQGQCMVTQERGGRGSVLRWIGQGKGGSNVKKTNPLATFVFEERKGESSFVVQIPKGKKNRKEKGKWFKDYPFPILPRMPRKKRKEGRRSVCGYGVDTAWKKKKGEKLRREKERGLFRRISALAKGASSSGGKRRE